MVMERALHKVEIWYLDAENAKQRMTVDGASGRYEVRDGLVRIYRGDRTTIIPLERLILIDEHAE